MKHLSTFAVLASLLIASTGTATAQNIRWNQVTPGNMEWSGKPGQNGTTTFNQIGPLTFGSDGSRAYTPGGAPVNPKNGDRFRMTDGNEVIFHGGVYMEFSPSGRHVRNCWPLAEGRGRCVDF